MNRTVKVGDYTYERVDASMVPADLRWDWDRSSSPEARVEYAHGRGGRYEAGAGATWRRVVDARWGTRYWRLVE